MPYFLNNGKDAYVEVLSEESITRYSLDEFLANTYVQQHTLPQDYGADLLFIHDIHPILGPDGRYRSKATGDLYTYWTKTGKLVKKRRIFKFPSRLITTPTSWKKD